MIEQEYEDDYFERHNRLDGSTDENSSTPIVGDLEGEPEEILDGGGDDSFLDRHARVRHSYNAQNYD